MTLRPCNTCGSAHYGLINDKCPMLTPAEHRKKTVKRDSSNEKRTETDLVHAGLG